MMAGRVPCPTCRREVLSLSHHFGEHPECDTLPSEQAPPKILSSTAGQGAHAHYGKQFARRVNLDYADLRYKKFVDTSHCAAFHDAAMGWMELLIESMLDAAASANTVALSLVASRDVAVKAMEIMRKYASEAQRDAYLKETIKVPYIAPSAYNKSAPLEYRKYAAKLSLSQSVGRILQNDDLARAKIIAKSNEWKTGKFHMKRATVLSDIDEGWRCRSHPHLMRKATPAEEKVIRIGIADHNDDITLVNAIGTKRGEHKDSITSASIINLPINMRHMFEYILLLSVVNSKHLKEKGGLLWSVCGVDEKGEETVSDSLASEFRMCSFPIELPPNIGPMGQLLDPVTGASIDPKAEPIKYRVELYFIVFIADWLASMALGYTPESTSATYPCGDCWWLGKAARKRCGQPTKRKKGKHGEARSRSPSPPMRTHEELSSTAQRLKREKLSKSALAKQMTEGGINTLNCVLDPDRIPHADRCCCCCSNSLLARS